MDIVVRRATPQDVPAVADLAALTFPLACPPYHPAENIQAHIDAVLSVDQFTGYTTNPDFSLFLADMAGAIIGYALVDYRVTDEEDVALFLAEARPFAQLSKLYVHPEFHGVGIAHVMLTQVLEDASRRGIRSVWLTVAQTNARANAFYEKSGFANVAKREYRVGNLIDDDFLRVRLLDAQARILES